MPPRFIYSDRLAWVRRLYYAVRKLQPERLLSNVLRSTHQRCALLSYVTYPFRSRNRFYNTQYLQVQAIAAVLDNLGFRVDVADVGYRRAVNYSRYQLIIGFGLPVLRFFGNQPRGAIVIFYCPGIHNYDQNLATLCRAESFSLRYGRWLLDSCRFAEWDFTSLAAVCDAVFTLGNRYVVESFQRYTKKPVYGIPSPCFRMGDVKSVLQGKNWEESRRHFLWFGSNGLIHKGLDRTLEAFAGLPDLHLHVGGPLHREPAFRELMRPLLDRHSNLHIHGYIHLTESVFAELMSQCAFVVNPSCSEGGSPATLNVMASGGLIPLITRSASLDTEDFGLMLPDDEVNTLRQVAREVSQWSPDRVAQYAARAAMHAENEHSLEKCQAAFASALEAVLKSAGK